MCVSSAQEMHAVAIYSVVAAALQLECYTDGIKRHTAVGAKSRTAGVNCAHQLRLCRAATAPPRRRRSRLQHI